MSNLYIYEPATNGKVVIHTTMGDIEIELWSKEAPKACRNFLALIMEGYYENCIFHRIVANFIVQTGDPTGTGHGGESFYGEPFEDEPHQRLKFSRRGLVGMANDNVRNSNRSQFFITLDRTDELQNRHTIFGKVAADGNTIFNVLKIGQAEVGADERPVYPPKIKSIEILDNPFEDIVPRITAAERRKQEQRRRESAREQREREERKNVKKKNTKVLSFGDEAEEEEAEASREKKSLIRPDMDASVPASIPSFESLPPPPAPVASASRSRPACDDDDDEGDYVPDLSKVRQRKVEEEDTSAAKRQKDIERMEANLRKLSRRRSGSPDSDDEHEAKKRKGPSLLEAELAAYTRGRAAKGKGRDNEDDVLAALGMFTKKLSRAPKGKEPAFKGDSADAPDGDADEQAGDGVDVDDDLGWMGHRLVEVRAERDAETTRRAENDYEVIDTRTDKGRGHLEPGRGGGGAHRGPPGRHSDNRGGGERGRDGGGRGGSRTAYNVGRGGGRGGGYGGGGGGGGGGARRGWD